MEEEKKNRKLVSSSMVDLKAELFRKQEEFKKQKAKSVGFINAKKFSKDTKSSIWSKQNSGVLARAQKDLAARERDVDEEEMLAKSRRILEQKTKMYDSITSSSTIPEEDGSEYYLVDFQKKAIDAIVEQRETKRRLDDQKEEDDVARKAQTDEISEASCPEDEWVDFVDSLGRDRRCMKKDLALLMKKDEYLALAQAKKSSYDLEPGGSISSKGMTETVSNTPPHLMSPGMHRELMRQKWENETKELLDKGQDEVHYSNVQFDEIRAHGVGYYQFSKDHSKRQEELEKLKKMREETKIQQTSKEKIKDKRKAMLEARLTKVRQRRKLKAEVVEDEKPVENTDERTDIGPKLSDAALTTRTVEDIQKEEETKEAEEKRKNHVREWDKEKVEGSTWELKSYMTARRKERENEFAPPSLYFELNANKLGNTHEILSNADRLKRLKESISTPEVKEDKGRQKGDKEQLSMSSTLSFVDKTLSNSYDTLGSIPLPEGSSSANSKDCNEKDQTLFIGSSQSFYTTQSSVIPHWQQSQKDIAVSQFSSGEYASTSRSWEPWGLKQGTVPPHQNEQQLIESQNLNPLQPGVHYFQHSIGQNSQGAQGHNPTLSGLPPQIHLTSQHDSHPNFNSTFTSSDSLKETNVVPNSYMSIPKQDLSAASVEPPAPKKPKVPKLSVVDMRFMNNFDTSSINPEPGRVPDVVGVLYKPGTFSKYRPHGVDGVSDSRSDVRQGEKGMEEQEGAQISGGPHIYTKEQLERQQKELDEQRENTNEAVSDDDRKLQDFLSSIRSST